ncbi:MAG TPA: HAMP domain-containing sensor histidine kinase [Caldilineaceae bacterium]|nr:HAMP domain-containing sensor histidine kinase [Caldilineaceae bacterium]
MTIQTIQPARQPIALPLRFLGGVLLALALTLAIFLVAMRPPLVDFQLMGLFLGATALISLIAGYALYRSGWITRSPHLHWTLLSTYVLSSVLTFINVWVTARLMFLNQHDLVLATVLLVFATGIAISLGYFLSATVSDNLKALTQGAREIARGRLNTRVHIPGRDETADLARSFNHMAAQLETAARKQQELDALRRELIAWVGHDLRTPLASVRAIIEALADGVVEDPDTVQRYLRTAKRDIDALAVLIDDLFEMAQIDAGGLKLDRRPNSLADLISDTLESFRTLAQEKGVALNGAVVPDVDPVVLDARQIGRVLSNLVSNAIRHTPAGGSVAVRAFPVPDGVRVEVTDTGEGIRSEDLPRVFEQFYRGEKSRSRATGGAGLGLAIAKGIVEAHGGRIGVQSAPGQETVFYFLLPRVRREALRNPLRRTRA